MYFQSIVEIFNFGGVYDFINFNFPSNCKVSAIIFDLHVFTRNKV